MARRILITRQDQGARHVERIDVVKRWWRADSVRRLCSNVTFSPSDGNTVRVPRTAKRRVHPGRGSGEPAPVSRSFLEPLPDGVILTIRVIPRASKTGIAGTRDGALLVRIAAAPVDDAANAALVDLLASLLRTSRRQVSLVTGSHNRRKRVQVLGVDAQSVISALAIER